MDATNNSSQAQIRLHIYIHIRLRSCCQVIERSDEQEENPLFPCPDHCRAIVASGIVPGQTQPLLHETTCCGSTVTCWGGRLPGLDAALHVFLTLPGHTSTREDEGQPVVDGVMRLPAPPDRVPNMGIG